MGKLQKGDRVVRANTSIGRISVGDLGTVVGYKDHSTVLVIYDRITPNVSSQQERNLQFVKHGDPSFRVPEVDAAFKRDGLTPPAALALAKRLTEERAVVQPPRPAARWTFRRDWRKAAPTVHGAFMGLARILRGL